MKWLVCALRAILTPSAPNWLAVGRNGYDFYMKATEKDKKDSDVQVAILLTLLGPDSMDIFRSFEWATEIDKDDVEIVKEKFRIYYTL